MESQNDDSTSTSQFAISNMNHIEFNSKTQSLAYFQLYLQKITRKIDTVQKIENQDIQTLFSVRNYLDITSISESDSHQTVEFLQKSASQLAKQLQKYHLQRLERRGLTSLNSKSGRRGITKTSTQMPEPNQSKNTKQSSKVHNKKTKSLKKSKGVGKTVHGRCFGQAYLIPLPKSVVEHANQVQQVKLPEIDQSMTITERRQTLKKRKLIQNRASVKACRIRKIGYKNSLEKEIQIMENEIHILTMLKHIYSILSQLKKIQGT